MKKLEQILVGAWLFLLPWQTRLFIVSGNLQGDYWEYGTISLYAIDILLLAIIIIHLVNHYHFGFKSFFKHHLLLFILLFGLIAANLFFSLNIVLSLFHFVWLALAGLIFLIIRQNVLRKKIALLCFIAGVSVACLFGVWQFINQTAPASTILGVAVHDSAELGTSVVETIAPDGRPERWLRAYGPLDHPNMLGGLATIGLLLLIYVIWRDDKILNQKERIFCILATISLTAGLIVSFSRAAWLALLIGLVNYLIFLGRARLKNFVSKLLPTALIAVVTIALFAVPYYYLLWPRLTGQSRLEQISATERIVDFKEAWPLIIQHPLIGSGLGTYGLALEKQFPEELVWYYQPIHNTFILLAAEIGLIGLAILIWLVILLAKASCRETEKKLVATAVVAALVILLFFDHWLLSLHFGIIFSAAIFGFLTAKNGFDSWS